VIDLLAVENTKRMVLVEHLKSLRASHYHRTTAMYQLEAINSIRRAVPQHWALLWIDWRQHPKYTRGPIEQPLGLSSTTVVVAWRSIVMESRVRWVRSAGFEVFCNPRE
jgi:hypothetical protein